MYLREQMELGFAVLYPTYEFWYLRSVLHIVRSMGEGTSPLRSGRDSEIAPTGGGILVPTAEATGRSVVDRDREVAPTEDGCVIY